MMDQYLSERKIKPKFVPVQSKSERKIMQKRLLLKSSQRDIENSIKNSLKLAENQQNMLQDSYAPSNKPKSALYNT